MTTGTHIEQENSAARRMRNRLVIYIDGYCERCNRVARLLTRLDRAGALSIRSFRHDLSYSGYGISLRDVSTRMFVVDSGTLAQHHGFRAIEAIARRLRILWVSVPFLWLVRRLGAGAKLYDWLADNRLIIPHPGQCDETCSPSKNEV